MSTYILLKDLPNAKAGTELNTDHAECPKNWYAFIDPRGQLVKFAAYDVENMPDWFKIKEEKVWTDSDMIEFSRKFTGHKWDDIKTGLQEFKLMKQQNSKI